MRKLIVAIAFGAVFIPTHALTLGLGEIDVSSALNQNLDAEIELLSAAEGDEELMIVKLASRDEFTRAGLDRPFMLGSLKFSTFVRDGKSYIKVTSPKPVREPFLNFLVEVDWPQGHLIREFTLLLDPPIFSGKTEPLGSTRPAAVSRPVAEPASIQPVGDVSFRPGATTSPRGDTLSIPTSNESRPSAMQPKTQMGAVAAGDDYRIKKGDTAWSVASSLLPDQSISVEKMMLALLRTNPEAFINNNVNGLKRGYILRVPDVAEINSIYLVEARAILREQNALWREYQQSLATGKPMQGLAGDKKPTASSSKTTEQGRLAIVGVDGATAKGTDPTAMSVEELRNELALTSERLETERLEKEGLKNRINGLESQVDDLKKGLIDIEDSEMSKLRSSESSMEEAVKSAVTETVVAESAAAKVVEKAEPVAAPQVAKPATITKPKTASRPEPMPKPGLLEDPMILMAGGSVLLILIGLIVLLLKKRKKSKDDDDSPKYDDEVDESATDEAVETDVDEQDQAETEADEAEEESHDATVVLQAPVETEQTEQTIVTEAVTADAGDQGAATEPEEADDVIAEADVYLAYGIYQQAEELLEGAIKQHPERDMYRVKLCETLYASKNTEGFESTAKELHDKLGGEETAGWLKVAALGKDLCPDSELFKGVNVEPGAVTEIAEPVEMDIDLGAEEAVEDDLDFSLDDALATPVSGDAVAEDSASDVDELEFDLSETDALDASENMEDEFALDINESELDIDSAETTAGDSFVDSSLDFDMDEIEETADTKADSGTNETGIDEFDGLLEDGSASDDLTEDALDLSDIDEDDVLSMSDLDTGDDDMLDLSDLDTDDSDDVLNLSDLDDGTDTDDVLNLSELEDSAADDILDLSTDAKSTDTADDIDIDFSVDESTAADDATKLDVSDDDLDMDFSGLDDVDEVSTKLDLARAYLDMGDRDGTRSIIDEILVEGNDEQKKEAEGLLKELDG